MKTLPALLLAAMLAACSDAMMSPPPPPPPPTTISVSYCSPFEPLWVAFQDGDGPWTHVTPTTANGNTVFEYGFSSNRGAIATVLDAAPGSTFLQVLYGAPEELTSVGISSPRVCGLAEVKTLFGTVAGVDVTDVAVVRGGFISEAVVHSGGTFALDVLPPGPRDILAALATQTATGPLLLTKLILLRGIDLPDGASLPVLDFNSPEAFAPVLANVTLEGVGQDGAFVLTRLRTSNFESQFSFALPDASGPVRPYFALPENRLLPGDLQALTVTTHGGTPNASRSVLLYFRTAVNRTLDVGPDVIAPAISTVATSPSLRLSAHFTPQDEFYDRETSIFYTADGTSNVGVSMTTAYAVTRGGYDLIVPEFSGVAGFNQAWALHAAPSVRWSASRLGGTLGLGFDPVPTNNAIQWRAFATDVITP
jgi:hypothetical protein